MRTIVTGIIVFILWSALCTWYYLRYIKGSEPEETPKTEQTMSEMTPEVQDSLPAVAEPEPVVESPGSYTVHHEFNRSEIIPDPGFDSYVEKLMAFREQVPDSKLDVTGHADNIGSDNYNYRLGMRRARSTFDYLVKMGIPGEIITVSSKGESDPVATNETDAGRANNRRTEIHIIE